MQKRVLFGERQHLPNDVKHNGEIASGGDGKCSPKLEEVRKVGEKRSQRPAKGNGRRGFRQTPSNQASQIKRTKGEEAYRIGRHPRAPGKELARCEEYNKGSLREAVGGRASEPQRGVSKSRKQGSFLQRQLR